MGLKQELFIAREWLLAHRAYNVWPDWRELRTVQAIYGTPARHYHTWQHIYETLLFVRKHYGFQPQLVFALIYHDVIYSVQAKSGQNEHESAIVWETYAALRGLNRYASLKVRQVSDLIRMTAKHKVEPGSPLIFSMMSDADMSIFLCPDEHYLQYARDIWREYQSVGRDAYLAGRLAFLDTVDPQTMFYTYQARERVHHAVANLALERTILEDTPEVILR